jgi:hypothetical protein
METLLGAAARWREPPSTATDGQSDDHPLLVLYRAQLAASRSGPLDENTVRKFVDLVRVFGATPSAAARSAVVRIDGARRVTFAPLATPPGGHFDAQRDAFLTLLDYWQQHDVIDELIIDLADATRARAMQLMRGGVAVDDVVRGIRIWETLPCRVRAVTVLQPERPWLAWFLKRSAQSFTPAKVLRKTRFVARAEHHGPRAEERQVDGHADVRAIGGERDGAERHAPTA